MQYALIINKCDRPRNTRREMYAGHVVCCPLVSHAEYEPCIVLSLEKRQDRWTDGRQTVILHVLLDTANVMSGLSLPQQW